MSPKSPPTNEPLDHLDDWEESLRSRYPAPANGKAKEDFRDYRAEARPSVKEFYRLNHQHQTLDFVLTKKREYLPLRKRQMGIWEAMEFLNTLVDDSDPDTDLSQIEHLLQADRAETEDDRCYQTAGPRLHVARREIRCQPIVMIEVAWPAPSRRVGGRWPGVGGRERAR